MKTEYFDLKNKRALVSGGASGIGASIVEHLCEQGVEVYFFDINKNEAKKTINKIKKKKFKTPSFVECNIKNIKKYKLSIFEIIKKKGPIDILVNNASNDQRHSLEKITEKYWDDRMAINLKHYLFAIQAVKKSMIKNNGGSIINLGSVSWLRGAVMFPAYSTAKAGIHGLTRSLARDLGKYNIRINSIAPGSIATERQSKLWLNPKFKKEILKNQALKKQLLPKDVSKMVLFLASEVSWGCTKQNFTVDAGLI
ncbi:SDR family NAD(P)-dependent oxidoreductase [Candidatus Pelagibacter sp.]|uniref:SDR family NAD(P)-dependent oxidoreductase n=1 Tax=Candidatus Pelagibacter sp. TaxID=2024849 RepID=UPI003F8746EA